MKENLNTMSNDSQDGDVNDLRTPNKRVTLNRISRSENNDLANGGLASSTHAPGSARRQKATAAHGPEMREDVDARLQEFLRKMASSGVQVKPKPTATIGERKERSD
jgi:hypothetical protein